MAHGGARNRSGPQLDPRSARSDTRRVVLTALPSEGYEGQAPDFPLPSASEREIVLWQAVWGTPQACAWISQPWRWYAVAQYVRWAVAAEAQDASAATLTGAMRLADQIGLSPAGLKDNGWAISADELAQRAADRPKSAPVTGRRLRVAPGEGGA